MYNAAYSNLKPRLDKQMLNQNINIRQLAATRLCAVEPMFGDDFWKGSYHNPEKVLFYKHSST